MVGRAFPHQCGRKAKTKMCVICHKGKKDRLPTADEIRAMWERNPDGAGVMWRRKDGKIEFRKGFMKLREFQAWHEAMSGNLKGLEVAYHFRITTHGGTMAGNCHPFVADGKTDPHEISGVGKFVLMHNGIISEMGNGVRRDAPDSAELARYVGQTKNPDVSLEYLAPFIESGNRLLMFCESGRTVKLGDWKELDGLSFSNLYHASIPASAYAVGGGYGWYGSGADGLDDYDDGVREYDMFVDEHISNSSCGCVSAILENGKFVSAIDGGDVALGDVDITELSEAEYSEWEDLVVEEADELYWKSANEMEK